jgi:hypothetical protein
MSIAIAPNIQPHRHDSEQWPALVPDIPDGAREPDRHSLARPDARKQDRLRAMR